MRTRDNGVKPEFDFGKMSWDEGRKSQRLQYELRRAVLLLEDPATLLDKDRFEAALAEHEAVMDRLETAMCRILISVPVEWLIPGAPDDLDWTDRTALRWLQVARFKELQAAMADANTPESVTGG